MRTFVRSFVSSIALAGALAAPCAADDFPNGEPAPPPAAAYHPAAARSADGSKETGFAFEIHLGSQLLFLGGNTPISLGVLQGGFFAGYKLGRIIFGLGFDLQRIASGMSRTGQADTSDSQTQILFMPGVRVAILRSSDGRVELFGEGDLGFGHAFSDSNPSPPPGPDKSNFQFVYQVGPGVRFWAHPQFAFSAVAGVRGLFATQSSTFMNMTDGSSSGLTSIFGQIQILGVY